MLSLPPTAKIYLCTIPADMRKSFDTLAYMALPREHWTHCAPTTYWSGSCVKFVGGRGS